MNTAQVTAAPLEIELSGKKYLLSPMRDRDYGEFQRWVQSRIIQLAKDNLNGLSEDEKKFLLVHAYEKASNIKENSPETLRTIQTIEGAAKLAFIMMRKNHPELTEDRVLELFTDPENVSKTMDGIDTLLELDSLKLPVTDTQNQKKALSKKPPKKKTEKPQSINGLPKNTDGELISSEK